MLLCKVLPVHVALWDRIVRVDRQRCVSNLNGQPVLEIEQADLAHVLELAAGLADLCLLEPRVTARPPPKHRERPRADLALLVVHRSRLQTVKSNQRSKKVMVFFRFLLGLGFGIGVRD